jgi:hypothetical protein
MLVERYGFQIAPRTLEEMSAGLIFKDGVFDNAGIDALEVHDDGIVVKSKTSSDVLSAFVKDLTTWTEATLGLRRVETQFVSKGYMSELTVHTAVPIMKFADALQTLSSLLSKSLKAHINLDAHVEPVGIAVGTDNALLPVIKPIPFRLERRAGVPFHANLYYSQAPLPTAEHLGLLERFEKLVT